MAKVTPQQLRASAALMDQETTAKLGRHATTDRAERMRDAADLIEELQNLRMEREQWRPMATAPKDGSLLRLLVEFENHATVDGEGPQPTIGSNTWDNHHDFDQWQFAGWDWEQDCYTQGVGVPVGWLPLQDNNPMNCSTIAQPCNFKLQ